MKRRLNILCIAVFLILGFSLYSTGYQFGMGMKMGMNFAEKKKEVLKKQDHSFFSGDVRSLDIVPVGAMWEPDSILNVKTGENVPVVYSKITVRVSPNPNLAMLIIPGVCTLLSSLMMVVAMICFILLINNINKSIIFEWRNVSRLRWLGGLLIASFICNMIPKVAMYWGLSEIFDLKNYFINPLYFQITDLLLGVGCLIVAETFAIGLKMKEEQELTI